jgi:nitroreductase
MELQDVVRRRRMVRRFDPSRPVPRELVERLLENAVRAPSAGFSQGWAFVVLDGAELERFWELTTDPGWTIGAAMGASHVILPLARKQAYLDRYSLPDKAGYGMDREEGWPVPYWIVDTAFASMLMLLTAVDEGLDALFFGLFRGADAALADLGVPDGYQPIGAIAIGYRHPEDQSRPSLRNGRRPTDEVVHWGRWGGSS